MGFTHKIRQLNVGQQVSLAGGAVVATAKMHRLDSAEIETAHEIEMISEVGNLSPAVESQLVFSGVKGMRKGRVTYEQILYELESVFGTVAPSGAGPYVRTYTNPHASAYTPKFQTWEYGTSTALYKAVGMICHKVKISMKKRGLWEFTSDWNGQALSTLTTLASLSDTTATSIRTADTILYIDAVGGTAGSTPASNTLIAAELEVDTGIELTDDIGSITANDIGLNEWKGTLEITAEFNASSKALLDELLGNATVIRQYQLKATSGTKIVALSFAGSVDGKGIKLWEDEKGNCAIKFKVMPLYNTALGGWLKAAITNGTATIV